MNKLLNIYEKIEDCINAVLIMALGFFSKSIWWLTPALLKRFIHHMTTKIENGKHNLIRKREDYKQKSMTKIHRARELSLKKAEELKGLPYKEILLEHKEKLEKVYRDYPLKSWPQLTWQWLMELRQIIKKHFRWLTPGTVFLALFSLSVAGTAAYYVNQSYGKIAIKAGWRAPASVNEFQFYRPPYFKEERKQLRYERMEVPVYVENVNSLRKIHLEFVVTFSNRYTKKMLSLTEMDAKIRDQINTNFEPVIPTFPLTIEGKKMVKDKLMNEFNDFLIDNNIQGEIEDIRLVRVLSY